MVRDMITVYYVVFISGDHFGNMNIYVYTMFFFHGIYAVLVEIDGNSNMKPFNIVAPQL